MWRDYRTITTREQPQASIESATCPIAQQYNPIQYWQCNQPDSRVSFPVHYHLDNEQQNISQLIEASSLSNIEQRISGPALGRKLFESSDTPIYSIHLRPVQCTQVHSAGRVELGTRHSALGITGRKWIDRSSAQCQVSGAPVPVTLVESSAATRPIQCHPVTSWDKKSNSKS